MSFGRLKTRLRALINRKDFTDELAGDFILDAIANLERNLRIGPMEKVYSVNTWNGTDNFLLVPPDYLQTIAIFTDNHELTKMDLHQFLQADPSPGDGPQVYTRIGDRWLVKPTPPTGAYLYLHYYHETARPQADDDKTVWTEAGFLATLYKAAELAADFYQMEQGVLQEYGQKSQMYAEEIAGQALDEHWSGRLVVPSPSDLGEY